METANSITDKETDGTVREPESEPNSGKFILRTLKLYCHLWTSEFKKFTTLYKTVLEFYHLPGLPNLDIMYKILLSLG